MFTISFKCKTSAILIVNMFKVATWVWPAVKPFINPDTFKKIKLVSKPKTLATIQEYIDIDQIPTFLGGNCDVGEHLDKDCGPWNREWREARAKAVCCAIQFMWCNSIHRLISLYMGNEICR